MTPAMAELLNRYRRLIAAGEEQIRQMELGSAGRGGFTIHTNGQDTTDEAISRVRSEIGELQRLVDKHDPDGWTKIV